MAAVGTRPVALGVMLVVFSVSCIDYVYSGKACCMLHLYSNYKTRCAPVHGRSLATTGRNPLLRGLYGVRSVRLDILSRRVPGLL
jgi:hypothetical protein